MQIYHHSQQRIFRDPFGAVEPGTRITLRLRIEEPETPVRVWVRFWQEGAGESLLEMKPCLQGDPLLWETQFPVLEHPGLLWYFFRIQTPHETFFYGNQPDHLGGEGRLYFHEPPSWQITVYKKREVPAWYKEGLVYQIFPDRYRRGTDWLERLTRVWSEKTSAGSKRIFRQSWDDTPAYSKNQQGEVTHWDFFGGTLKGICEKCRDLASFGVTVLYLNPIFQAASNHGYDTADYFHIDPLLGDEEDLKDLCQEARKYGISIILDGVFSHTGSDSLYFDRYGHYGGGGAWKNPDSVYADWYCFHDSEHTQYECWWNTADLPSLNKNDPSCQQFFYSSQNSVLRHWMRCGVKGWRLDVADELPDFFIQGLKKTLLEEDPEGLLLGEVWEDASHKVSYGVLRQYFWGDELDCVMNYPLRKALLEFILGQTTAAQVGRILKSLQENYPPEAFYANLNLLGSHDRIRLLTLLGEAPPEQTLSEEERREYRLSAAQRHLAQKRLELLALLQMTLPGVPCIYYGDEVGAEGYSDPYNRGPYPWEKENEAIKEAYQTAIALRKAWPVCVDGSFEPVECGEEVLAFYRRNKQDTLLVVVNRSDQPSQALTFSGAPLGVWELLQHHFYPPQLDGNFTFFLPPWGKAVFHWEKPEKLGRKLTRGAGILLAVSSLPSEWGSGTLGKAAHKWLDFLAAAGQKYWQILPANPTDRYGSPYAGPSAFAGNEDWIDLEELEATGLLQPEELAQAREMWHKSEKSSRMLSSLRNALLRKTWKHFVPDEKYHQFVQENAFWLEGYTTFKALKRSAPDVPWQKWPTTLPEDEGFEEERSFGAFCQYVFDWQWQKIRLYAQKKGIYIIGDLPMYVNVDSADVWQTPERFQLDSEGNPESVAGVPPDSFSDEGQVWNQPLYDWNFMQQEDYVWWKQRIAQGLRRFDWVRLDHFRGFERYWEIPVGKRPAEGCFRYGPGKALFDACYETLGTLPLLAEDLGQITVEVRNLLQVCGFPGMDVFQFEPQKWESVTVPKTERLLYSGTHDNQTLVGWCQAHRPEKEARQEALCIMEKLYASGAKVVLLPLQDVLGLGEEARMNVPGTVGKNWRWQLQADMLTPQLAETWKKRVEKNQR